MRVAQLWRYPVKSMAGEQLTHARVRGGAIEGDRKLLVTDERGYVRTARSHPKLLKHRATIDERGDVLVDGRPWTSPEVARDVETAAGKGCRLVAHEGPDRFDILPLLVGTDGGIKEWGGDVRRIRPNLVVGGIEGWVEPDWQGQFLKIGKVVVAMRDLRARCVMVTFDPDTLKQDVNVLRDIARRFHGFLCLNSVGINEGAIAVGDPVELAEVRSADELKRFVEQAEGAAPPPTAVTD